MYTTPDNGNIDTYVVQGTELNAGHLPSPVFVNVERMTNDGTSEFVVDPSLYYPAATSYGYYCTGFESPSEWDDHHAVFGVDGADVQYTGAQTENLSYVYYTPSYGYGDSPFNPYNPYIPGAMIGVDGVYGGTQPYYTVSPYHNAISSPGYVPVLVQPGSDIVASSSTDTLSDVGSSAVNRVNASSSKLTHSSNSTIFSVNPSKAASSQGHAPTGTSQGPKINTGTTKRAISNRTGGPVNGASSHMSQGGTSISLPSGGNMSYGKLLPQGDQVKLSFPVGGGLSDYGPGTNGHVVLNDPWSKFYYRRTSNDMSANTDQLGEQNRGPRTNKSKNQFIVKAYTTKAGDCNPDGNIIISADEYNRGDFPVDYVNAKFFVIKSYSEDDVHKSIKYNVWSSTPNGNKKLNNAYEEAQKIAAGTPKGCPIFLFFSVNASGQFCGVAEMVGAVDFDKDMDFWQQDKWSGSFPVKWHIIKDVPNPTFRHIILENNEHKPVTNSRDTQEIMFKQGMEMLRIFNNYSSKTSLLDDFMYYENRQKIMHEERARLLRKANVNGHAVVPPVMLASMVDRPRKEDEMGTWVEKAAQANNSVVSEKMIDSSKKVSASPIVVNSGATSTNQSTSEHNADVSTLKIGSLSIHPKQIEGNSTMPTSSLGTSMVKTTPSPSNVVTVGSVPIKVDAVNRTSGMLTIGTIPLDPKALQQGKMGTFGKSGPQK